MMTTIKTRATVEIYNEGRTEVFENAEVIWEEDATSGEFYVHRILDKNGDRLK